MDNMTELFTDLNIQSIAASGQPMNTRSFHHRIMGDGSLERLRKFITDNVVKHENLTGAAFERTQLGYALRMLFDVTTVTSDVHSARVTQFAELFQYLRQVGTPHSTHFLNWITDSLDCNHPQDPRSRNARASHDFLFALTDVLVEQCLLIIDYSSENLMRIDPTYCDRTPSRPNSLQSALRLLPAGYPQRSPTNQHSYRTVLFHYAHRAIQIAYMTDTNLVSNTRRAYTAHRMCRFLELTARWLLQIARQPIPTPTAEYGYAPLRCDPIELPLPPVPRGQSLLLASVPAQLVVNLSLTVLYGEASDGSCRSNCRARCHEPIVSLLLVLIGDMQRCDLLYLRQKLLANLAGMMLLSCRTAAGDAGAAGAAGAAGDAGFLSQHPHRLLICPALLRLKSELLAMDRDERGRYTVAEVLRPLLASAEHQQAVRQLALDEPALVDRFVGSLVSDAHALVAKSEYCTREVCKTVELLAAFASCTPQLMDGAERTGRLVATINAIVWLPDDGRLEDREEGIVQTAELCSRLGGSYRFVMAIAESRESFVAAADGGGGGGSGRLLIGHRFEQMRLGAGREERAALSAELQHLERRVLAMRAGHADVPTEFLDVITTQLMRDPVRWPGGRVAVERCTIERHLAEEEGDPFTRRPLRLAEVYADAELRGRIEAWKAEMMR